MVDAKSRRTPQKIIRDVMELCANCDTCRLLMNEDCAFFPELYRLWDREVEEDIPISEADLRSLIELCTLCGICPCPNIPADIIEAKTRYIEQEGLPLSLRVLTDVPRIGRLCGTFPRLAKALQSLGPVDCAMRKLGRLHHNRKLPAFPGESFFSWAAQKGLTARRESSRRVAYFAGCTAGFLFPQLGRATAEVLERNGVTVYVPPQECCGMPHYVEGNRPATLERVGSNLDTLLAALQAGEDLVTSCPTCGYFIKVLLKEKAYYSAAYQRSVNAGEDELKVPSQHRSDGKHRVLKKSIYKDVLKDDGYFSTLDPMARIGVAEHLTDAGEYLARLHAEGRLDTRFKTIPERVLYFAPCHQREQKMGRPYLALLALIPGLTIDAVEGMYCCGMGGNFGFKADFHETSLAVGGPLMERIREMEPQSIVTDCMSCRLQFNHTLPYPVFHPMEILHRAYTA